MDLPHAMRRAPFILTILLACFARAENWPQFRGPTGQGLSSERNLPTVWSIKTGQNILWKAPLPKSDNPFSSPIVWDNRVFVTLAVNKTREHHLLCFDAATGRRLWDSLVPPGPWVLPDLRGGYSAPTPATDGQHVYVIFGSAVLACLDFDGKLVWRYDMRDTAFDVAIGTSPILINDTLLFLADQNEKKSRLVAFDKSTGRVRYEQLRPNAAFDHTTPLLVSVNGRPQLLVAASHALQGIDPATGQVIWSFSTPGDVPVPVFAGGIAYTDSGRGSPAVAVDCTGNGDVTKSYQKWRFAKQIPEALASAVLVDGRLYRLHSPNILKCIDFATGQELYSQRLEGLSTWASPVAAADSIIYLASSGTSYVIRSSPTFDLLSTNPLNDPTPASAAVSNGRIFLRGAANLYCIAKP